MLRFTQKVAKATKRKGCLTIHENDASSIILFEKKSWNNNNNNNNNNLCLDTRKCLFFKTLINNFTAYPLLFQKNITTLIIISSSILIYHTFNPPPLSLSSLLLLHIYFNIFCEQIQFNMGQYNQRTQHIGIFTIYYVHSKYTCCLQMTLLI